MVSSGPRLGRFASDCNSEHSASRARGCRARCPVGGGQMCRPRPLEAVATGMWQAVLAPRQSQACAAQRGLVPLLGELTGANGQALPRERSSTHAQRWVEVAAPGWGSGMLHGEGGRSGTPKESTTQRGPHWVEKRGVETTAPGSPQHALPHTPCSASALCPLSKAGATAAPGLHTVPTGPGQPAQPFRHERGLLRTHPGRCCPVALEAL